MIAVCLREGWPIGWIPVRTIYADERSHIRPRPPPARVPGRHRPGPADRAIPACEIAEPRLAYRSKTIVTMFDAWTGLPARSSTAPASIWNVSVPSRQLSFRRLNP